MSSQPLNQITKVMIELEVINRYTAGVLTLEEATAAIVALQHGQDLSILPDWKRKAWVDLVVSQYQPPPAREGDLPASFPSHERARRWAEGRGEATVGQAPQPLSHVEQLAQALAQEYPAAVRIQIRALIALWDVPYSPDLPSDYHMIAAIMTLAAVAIEKDRSGKSA